MKIIKIEKVTFKEVTYKSTSKEGNVRRKVTFEDPEGKIYNCLTSKNASASLDCLNCYLLKRKANIWIHKTQKGNLLIDFCQEIRNNF